MARICIATPLRVHVSTHLCTGASPQRHQYTPDTCSHYHVLKDFLTSMATASTQARLRQFCDEAHRSFINYLNLSPDRHHHQDLMIIRVLCGFASHKWCGRLDWILKWPWAVVLRDMWVSHHYQLTLPYVCRVCWSFAPSLTLSHICNMISALTATVKWKRRI